METDRKKRKAGSRLIWFNHFIVNRLKINFAKSNHTEYNFEYAIQHVQISLQEKIKQNTQKPKGVLNHISRKHQDAANWFVTPLLLVQRFSTGLLMKSYLLSLWRKVDAQSAAGVLLELIKSNRLNVVYICVR